MEKNIKEKKIKETTKKSSHYNLQTLLLFLFFFFSLGSLTLFLFFFFRLPKLPTKFANFSNPSSAKYPSFYSRLVA